MNENCINESQNAQQTETKMPDSFNQNFDKFILHYLK